MGPELLLILPPVPHSRWWWWVVAGLVLLGVGCTVLAVVLWRRSPAPPRPDDSLDRLREEVLAEIDHAETIPDPREASQLVVAAVKRFVGTISDGDADYCGPQQLQLLALRDPRLAPLAQFVTATQQDCFDPTHHPDPHAIASEGRQVIHQWP